MTALDDALTELYGLTPSEFTAARNALAATVRRNGDRQTATAIAGLAKPSASAWILNVLARTDADGLDRIAELGTRYRTAERDADRAALVSLNAERRSLLAAVSGTARDAAKDAGHPLNARAADEVTQSLRAAIADENAATALLSGTLIAGMSANGIDAVDVAGVTAGTDGGAPRRKSTREGTAADRRRTEERQAEERREEQRRAEERRVAERRAAKAEKDWERAVARRDELADSVASLEQEIARVSQELAEATASEKSAHAAWRQSAE